MRREPETTAWVILLQCQNAWRLKRYSAAQSQKTCRWCLDSYTVGGSRFNPHYVLLIGGRTQVQMWWVKWIMSGSLSLLVCPVWEAPFLLKMICYIKMKVEAWQSGTMADGENLFKNLFYIWKNIYMKSFFFCCNVSLGLRFLILHSCSFKTWFWRGNPVPNAAPKKKKSSNHYKIITKHWDVRQLVQATDGFVTKYQRVQLCKSVFIL